jgi:putative ABC transport system permease protein
MQQLRFAQERALRFTTDQIVFFTGRCVDPLRTEIAKLPGVRAVSCASANALSFGENNSSFSKSDGSVHRLAFAAVDPDFFAMLGFEPVAGRFFDRGRTSDFFDPAKATTLTPVILNETAARQLGYSSPENAIGEMLTLGLPEGPSQREVVGVVPDFSIDVIRRPILPMLYFLDMRAAIFINVKLAPGDPTLTLDAIKGIWKRIGENRPFASRFLDQYIEETYRDITRQSQVFAIFAGIAVVLACLGLFGLAAFTAERRTKEIGIRKAMGADRGDILRLLLWQFLKPVLWANVIAWPVGYLVMKRWLEGFAYRIEMELWMFLAAGGAAVIIALVTVIGHALMVARARPVTALRYE